MNDLKWSFQVQGSADVNLDYMPGSRNRPGEINLPPSGGGDCWWPSLSSKVPQQVAVGLPGGFQPSCY